jgi:hypothetical protein
MGTSVFLKKYAEVSATGVVMESEKRCFERLNVVDSFLPTG